MNDVLWWSGLVFWAAFGILGMVVFSDWIMDRVIASVWNQREFLAFVWDRLKKRKAIADKAVLE